jgi:mono/diheme cytochrome c family protein
MAPLRVAFLLTVLMVAAVRACGGEESSGPTLPPAAEAGRQLAREKGCAACHGASGEGDVGPAFVGLYGSNVALADGTTVVADTAYLVNSIVDPASQKVSGYPVPMPQSDLSDAEIDLLVGYIVTIATPLESS